ncbi:unnamed protein product [Symbiodinium natans]|uniref:Fatty acid hydroxylase domain-containing protein n=1 Tax=Symbiodinium natans TaxID=878477 RepID=A0A812JUB0_9DINO|nr:unnamed protein product [Symbiodinium natans]
MKGSVALAPFGKIAGMYLSTWKVCISYLSCRWEAHAEATKEVQEAFVPVGMCQTMVLNVITYVPLVLFLNSLAGFSVEYQRFIAAYSLAPTLLMGLCYYYYLFRAKVWQLSMSDLLGWFNNWLMAMVISVVSFTQVAIHYILLLWLEQLLPSSWQGYMTFPTETIETSVRTVVFLLYGLGLVLLLTVPLWCEGYRLCSELAGRENILSKSEAVMEILYTTSQLAVVLQKQTALALIQIRWGFPFHFVHFAATLLENMFFHQMVQFKYAWIHKLCHEVQPLYRLAHLEHHICKGTYPTTPAAGLWEVWIEGGTLFFCNTLACVPYFFFHAAVSGPNIVVHTMWPQKSLVQWHTLHHVVHSDIYALNVPSKNDEEFSRDVKKFRKPLQSSFFVRHPDMSDVAGFAMVFFVGLVLHYGAGIGLFQVWHERIVHQ